MRSLVVTIDGVSGSGKSTTAAAVAKALKLPHLDTGASYRALTLVCREKGIPSTDLPGVRAQARELVLRLVAGGRVVANGRDVTRAIREVAVSREVSDFCTDPQVRDLLVRRQREMCGSRGCVAEGRDTGTVVFPDASLKFYLWATDEVRAHRRHRELLAQGIEAGYSEVLENLRERDAKDSKREASPLVEAPDAVRIDTSRLTVEQQVAQILDRVHNLPRVSGIPD